MPPTVPMDSCLPTGTVSFLFTDIEGSTRIAQDRTAHWEVLRERHHTILRAAIEANGGYIFKIIGDAFCVAFASAADALRAATASQVKLYAEDWGRFPIKVRMGIHTAQAQIQEDGDYRGYVAMSRVQRLMSAAHGGQVLVSLATHELVRDDLPEQASLRDLGERRLKDLVHAEHVHQLAIAGLPVDFPPIRTLDAYRHNLPIQLTSFIGREREIREIEQAIAAHRLVTLTGAGGSGKTRLCLQIAAELLDQFPDGVWFIELAPLANPELITQTVLSAFGIGDQPGLTSQQVLLDRLRGKRLLLVLDNCEHLIESSAQLVTTLIGDAADLKIMATSREALGVSGELNWNCPSLSLPDIANLPPVDRLSQFEAVHLFVDRATLAQPHFTLTKENARAVAQICLRLDGIPLAIELAAARVNVLAPEQIAKRLDDRFRLLTGGTRTALPRQQTLRAMIDWSYNLLAEPERLLFRRLAVFVGGWTLEAAESVCDGEGIESSLVLDLLSQLVRKSLVVVKQERGESRYSGLETVRQYAREKLFETDEAVQLRDRHAQVYSAWVERMAMELRAGPTQLARFKELEMEHGNIDAALEWTLGGGGSEQGLRLVGAIFYFWWRAGHWIKWERWIAILPAHIGQVSDSTQAAALVAMMAFELYGRRDLEAAKRHGHEALAIYRRLGDRRNVAWTIFWLNVASTGIAEEYAQVIATTEEAIALLRQEGELASVAQGFTNLGVHASVHGDLRLAKAAFQEALEIARGVGDQIRENIQYSNLGGLALDEGDYETALALFRRSLTWAGERENVPMILGGLANLTIFWTLRGQPNRAVRLIGAGEAMFESGGVKLQTTEQSDYDRTATALREQLGEEMFQTLRAEGRALTMERAIALALDDANV